MGVRVCPRCGARAFQVAGLLDEEGLHPGWHCVECGTFLPLESEAEE